LTAPIAAPDVGTSDASTATAEHTPTTYLAILATTPAAWWSAFGRSYTELRRETRGTRDARAHPPAAPGTG
jgi:hypothetical protein